MKIGLLSRWNATCGISLHAELIGFEFIKMGHNLKVFAPTIESASKWWHHKVIRNKDEDFVTRCYSEIDPTLKNNGWIDVDKILFEDLDFLIVESYASIPYNHVEKLVRLLKEKRKIPVIAVIHESFKEQIKYSNPKIFDAIVVFDERYIAEVVPECKDICKIIPYPCYPVKKGKRKFAEDVLTFFSFGRQPIIEYQGYIEVLDNLSEKYDFVYKVVRTNGLLPVERPWLNQEMRRLASIDEIYSLLHSSDIHLLPKGQTNGVVVSSTLFQCLGSLVPIVAPETRHFEVPKRRKPLVTYKNLEDLEEKLIRLIEDRRYRNELKRLAKSYVERNRCDKIAKKFIKIFKEFK